MAADAAGAPESRRTRLRLFALSLVVPLLFLAVAFATLKDYGETWDEQFDQDIGRFYWNDWATQGVKGLDRFIPLQRNYGPLFDVLDVATYDLLSRKLHWVTDAVPGHHVAVVLTAALTLWLVFRMGLVLFGPGPAFLAQVLLVLMPQFLGHAHNNLKDTPLTAFFTLALLLMVRAVRDGRWRWWALAGVATGLTYSFKVHEYFVPLLVVLWQLWEAGFAKASFSRARRRSRRSSPPGRTTGISRSRAFSRRSGPSGTTSTTSSSSTSGATTGPTTSRGISRSSCSA